MCVNNSPASGVRPNFWACVDDIPKFCHQWLEDPAVAKFVPVEKLHQTIVRSENGRLYATKATIGDVANVWSFESHKHFAPDSFLSEPAVFWGCGVVHEHGRQHITRDPYGESNGRSVMYPALKLLYVLGVRTVYLLGCDFTMQQDDPYGFDQWASQNNVQVNNESYRLIDRRFHLLRPYFEKAGFRVVNCTPGGNLTAFDRLPYDEALARTRMDPILVTQGRYERRKVTVVIPECGHHELTDHLVAALRRHEPQVEVIVVDDGKDATTRRREPAAGVRNERCGDGLTAAWNLGVRQASNDTIVLMNNDVEVSGPFVEKLQIEATRGIAGPEPWQDDDFKRDSLKGWCLAFRRATWERLGGFDERFRLYFSDTDFCHRAVAAGIRLLPVDVPLRHLGHRTAHDAACCPDRRAVWEADHRRFLEKHRFPVQETVP